MIGSHRFIVDYTNCLKRADVVNLFKRYNRLEARPVEIILSCASYPAFILISSGQDVKDRRDHGWIIAICSQRSCLP